MTSLIRLFVIIPFLALVFQTSFGAIVSSDEEQTEIDAQSDAHIYTVESLSPSDNPDEFVIDGKHYDPKTDCDVAVGDRMKFLVNTPYDCVDAKLYNYRTKRTCDVWCST